MAKNLKISRKRRAETNPLDHAVVREAVEAARLDGIKLGQQREQQAARDREEFAALKRLIELADAGLPDNVCLSFAGMATLHNKPFNAVAKIDVSDIKKIASFFKRYKLLLEPPSA